MTSTPRIAIIGAGPGGLTLARILQIHGIAATVFERDDHALSRPQGGTLDLHLESGQRALHKAGLEQQFLQIARYDDQGGRLYDTSANLLFADDVADDGERPEVDRTALRHILLDSLPVDTIRWGHAIRDIHQLDDGVYDLLTDNGSAGIFDLVVGADGAWSRVRPLVSAYKPQYSGLTFIEFGIDDVDNRHPGLSRLVGRGKIGVEGDSRGLIVQRNANSHLKGYAIFRVPLDWAEKTFDFSSPVSTRTRLAAEFKGWARELVDLIHASNDQIVSRPICALPVGHHWPNRPGITLIGDAAHVMSPFGGEGVNAAMLDAAELARHLIEADDWRDAVRTFEAEMFSRVIQPAEEAAEAAATELSHLGLELTLQHVQAHVEMRKAAARGTQTPSHVGLPQNSSPA